MNLTEHFIDIAKGVALEDPLRYTNGVDMDAVYELCASSILEFYLGADATMREEIIIATAIHLTVDNFLLNKRIIALEV